VFLRLKKKETDEVEEKRNGAKKAQKKAVFAFSGGTVRRGVETRN